MNHEINVFVCLLFLLLICFFHNSFTTSIDATIATQIGRMLMRSLTLYFFHFISYSEIVNESHACTKPNSTLLILFLGNGQTTLIFFYY